MVLDNFIKASKSFLGLFELDYENSKINELSDGLEKNKKLKIYDKNKNYVGILFICNGTYYFNIMLENTEICAKAYRNLKDVSKFEFDYSVIKMQEDKRLNGFYSIEKNAGEKPITKNELSIRINGVKEYGISFIPKASRFILIKKRLNEILWFNGKVFKYSKPKLNINISCFKDYLFYEKRYAPKLNKDISGGYLLENNASCSAEISKVLYDWGLGYEYFEFVQDFIKELDSFSNGFYYRVVNDSLKDNNASKRKIFKIKEELEKQPINSNAMVKKRKKEKRRNKKTSS